ncbi:retrovirus-related pol polyprotein from transposon TNT 1-94 [Tanacetum coccineum]
MIIKLKWLWKNKKDEDQTVIRNKARLVAKGYAQEEDADHAGCIDTRKSTSGGIQSLVVRLGINPMIQPEPEDLPKDNPKLEIAVLRKPRYGKIIPDVMLSDDIKEFTDYVNYLAKSRIFHLSVPTLGRGRGKGYMSIGVLEVNVDKKRKKVEVSKKRHTITVVDNILEDPNQAVELVVSVNLEEHDKREKERRTKARHATIVLDKEVDQEVNEGFKE